ncbi:MAG: hypothetical protein WD250_16295, partial [Egibacteraceae bacterium]
SILASKVRSLQRTQGDSEAVNWSLGHAAVYGRFAERDLALILAHRAAGGTQPTARASEDHSLQAGTNAWKEFGR